VAASARVRLAAAFRESGPRGVWFRLLSALGYRRLIITRHDLRAPQQDLTLPFAAEYCFLTDADIAEYATLRPGAERLARARFARGDRCFAVRTDDGLVYAIWFATEALYLEYLGRWLNLGPGEVGVYDAYVRPDVRGQGIARPSHRELRKKLIEAGYTATIAAAFPENPAGVRLQEGGAYLPVGTLRSLRIGRLGIDFGRRRDLPAANR